MAATARVPAATAGLAPIPGIGVLAIALGADRCEPILASVLTESYAMNFSEYQVLSSHFAVYPDCGENPIYPTLGLCGETGEVAEKVKKVVRDRNGVFDQEAITAITLELGDVLWYVAQLANELDINLDEVADNNLDKLRNRKRKGTLQGNGDDR